MVPTPKIVNVLVKCRKCDESISMEVDIDSLEFTGGLATVSILHGVPPHTLIAYIDENGQVRSTEVADMALLIPERVIEEKISSEDLEKLIGKKFFSVMFSAMVSDIPIYIITPSEPEKVSTFFETMFRDMPITIEVIVNKSVEHFKISIVEKAYKNKVISLTKPHIAYDLSKGDFENYNVKSKFMDKIVKKKMGKGFKALIELFEEVNRLKILFGRLLKEFDKSEKVLLKNILDEVKISNKELEYFKELLKLKGIDVDKRLIWNPFMKT